MRAVAICNYGEPDVLQLVERDLPEPGKGEVRVRLRATAVNRADVVQRRGLYPAPADVSQDVPGLEFSGEVDALGAYVKDWSVGDRVYGLAGGGTYAEYITVHSRTLARIPDNLSFIEAAAIPEAFVTAYDAIVVQAKLAAGNSLLITAVGSGVGTAAVQIAKAIGAISIGTARQQQKLGAAKLLGLHHPILSEDGEYASRVLEATGGAGADVILELVGGRYVAEDIRCASIGGTIMVVGLVAGGRTETDLGTLLRKRLTIKGTTLRMRPLEEKIIAGQLLQRNLGPLFASGAIKPVIDKTYQLERACDAHTYMEANENFGKIVLEI